jgi:hypothetical protein
LLESRTKDQHSESDSSIDSSITLNSLARLGILIAGAAFSALIAGRGVVAGSLRWVESDFPVHFGAIATAQSPYSLIYSPVHLAQKYISLNLGESITFLSGTYNVGMLFALKGLVVTYFAISTRFPLLISGFFALMLIAAMPFPTMGLDVPYYLGTLSPNVFHSATQILANALAIPAVYAMVMWFNNPTRGWTWAMAVSGIFASLAKPAITPAWALVLVALTLLLVIKKRISKSNLFLTIVIGFPLPLATILAAVFLAGAYWQGEPSDYVFAFGQVWGSYVDSIPLALLRSWAFPLVVLVLVAVTLGRKFVAERLAIPWALALLAALIFLLFAQRVDGVVNFHGNLAWAGIAATSALYVMSFLCVASLKLRYQILSLLVLTIQGVGGIMYLNRWVTSGTYF